MSNNRTLDDSLQACQDIQNNQAYNVMNSEIDRIVAQYSSENESVMVEKNEDAKEPEKKQTKKIQGKEKSSDTISSQHPVLKFILSILICLFTALVLALIITEYVAHHTSVEGSSMETTLENGDQIIVENISYYRHEPERFDIIVFPNSEGVNYIKRIIGLPGETVQILDGFVYINGQQLDEAYGNEVIEDAGLAKDEIQLGASEYFVLGDNRNGSIDSRRAEVGNVKREQIKGKAWLRFYPFTRFGSIK